ncbi:MAG: hypothetical protein VCD00_09480 [Candidatus Hydrogenedentota bacterium]
MGIKILFTSRDNRLGPDTSSRHWIAPNWSGALKWPISLKRPTPTEDSSLPPEEE